MLTFLFLCSEIIFSTFYAPALPANHAESLFLLSRLFLHPLPLFLSLSFSLTLTFFRPRWQRQCPLSPSLSSGFVFRFGFSPSECVFRFFTHNRPSCRRERSSKKKTTRSSQRTDIHDLEGGELSRTISPLRWRKLPKSWKLWTRVCCSRVPSTSGFS